MSVKKRERREERRHNVNKAVIVYLQSETTGHGTLQNNKSDLNEKRNKIRTTKKSKI